MVVRKAKFVQFYRMDHTLLDLAVAYADAHADRFGLAALPVPGVCLIRATQPGEIQVSVYKPMVAMLLQGSKEVSIGSQTQPFSAGQSMLIAADVPTVSQITCASLASPYYALVIELDPMVLLDLASEIPEIRSQDGPSVRVSMTDPDVADAASRLIMLTERPAAFQALSASLLREIHYWLLVGQHGSAIRALSTPDSKALRINRAIALIREKFDQSLKVDDLATAAGMSVSSFHEYFRQFTTLSPLQFQKQLRLIEARRQMLALGRGITAAAHSVGYESVSHFTRDYGRLFGKPPGQDMRAAIAA